MFKKMSYNKFQILMMLGKMQPNIPFWHLMPLVDLMDNDFCPEEIVSFNSWLDGHQAPSGEFWIDVLLNGPISSAIEELHDLRIKNGN